MLLNGSVTKRVCIERSSAVDESLEIRTEAGILVSIIMPIRNEAPFIGRSVRCVLAQDFWPGRMEVIIVDGMSSDGTRQVVEKVTSGSKIEVRVVDNPCRVVPTALNIGLRESQGKIIIRVDGHCEVAADYARRCVEALETTGADCVGGPMVTLGETRLARAIALAQSSVFGVGGVAFRTGRTRAGYVDTVAFGAYRRAVFERIGFFDEELVRNQDDEFNFRLIQAGGKIWMDPSIRSVYYSRATLQSLWRQYLEYGSYKVRLIQKRGAVPSWRHLVPGVFVGALLGSMVLTVVVGRPLWALTIAVPYILANLLASVLVARREWRLLPIIPLAYATLHFAYGLGFWGGIWRWREHFGRRQEATKCGSQAGPNP